MTSDKQNLSASTAALGEPFELPCGAVVPNRFYKAAMSEAMADGDGRPTPELTALYRRWAAGGTGLIVTGNVMVDGRHLGEPGNVVVEDERFLPQLREMAEAARSGGGQAWVQMNHPGRQSPRLSNAEPLAPSAVPIEGMEQMFLPPRALTVDEIAEIVQRFATTAAVVKEAGFDGVQIHAAHGYLVSQFLSPNVNRRDDRYGGPVENRMRFLVEIYEAIRAAVGPDFPIGVKLNSTDGTEGGFTEQDALAVAEHLGSLGLDLLEVSGGTYTTPEMQGTEGHGAFFADFARQLAAVKTCPVVVTGGFRDLETMGEALSSGVTDLIGLGRPLVMEPELPRQILDEGRTEPVVLPRISTGNAKLDEIVRAAMVNTWYEMQLRRVAKGKTVPRTGNGLAAMAFAVYIHGFRALRPRRASR